MLCAEPLEFARDRCIGALDFLEPERCIRAILVDFLGDPKGQIVAVVKAVRRYDSCGRPAGKNPLPLGVRNVSERFSVLIVEPKSA
jgi:hypothetical protein